MPAGYTVPVSFRECGASVVSFVVIVLALCSCFFASPATMIESRLQLEYSYENAPALLSTGLPC